MLYTEKEKNEIERIRKVFEKHIRQMTAYELVWSDKVGYVFAEAASISIYVRNPCKCQAQETAADGSCDRARDLRHGIA